MDSTRERWTRVFITAGIFLLSISLYFAWSSRQESSGYSVFDLIRGTAPPAPDPLETITTSTGPAVALEDIGLLSRLNEEYSRLIQAVLPSVVSIEVRRSVSPDFVTPAGDGSGFIVSHEGHIITNYHVIEEGDEIFVTLHGGSGRYKAQIVGVDPRADIAVLKISGGVSASFPALSLSPSEDVRVGEMVIAVGNPFGLSESVTRGIISGKERRLSDADTAFFQTDAVINPGSSGGPLLNLRGEVIGVNVYLYGGREDPSAWQGVGFAIPSNDVRSAFRAIMTEGRSSRGYLGISVEDIYPDTALRLGLTSSQGAVIMEVIRDSPAEHAGLRTDDVIRKFNGNKVIDTTDVIERVRSEPVDAKVVLDVVRDQNLVSIEVMMGERSTAAPLASQGRRGVFIGSMSDALGIEVADLSADDRKRLGLHPEAPAVVITKVRPGTPGAASLQAGDLIHALNRRAIYSSEEFIRGVNSVPLNRTSALHISHAGGQALFLFRASMSGSGK